MEIFGLAWILRHAGLWGFVAYIFTMAVCGAVLGLHYARENNLLPKNDSRILINIFKFALFLWVNWLLAFGIQYWVLYSLGWWILFAVLTAVAALSMSLLLTAEGDMDLAQSHLEGKFITWVIFSLLGGVTISIMLSSDAPLLTLTKQERASYLFDVFQNGKTNSGTLPSLAGVSHPLYAITQARMGQDNEASAHFLAHAESVSPEQRPLWLGLGHFFHGDFGSAEKSFEAAGKKYEALLSKFRNDQLSAIDLKQFIASNTIGDDDLNLFDRVREVLGQSALPPKDTAKQQALENATILTEIASLKETALKRTKGPELSKIVRGLEALEKTLRHANQRPYAPTIVDSTRAQYEATLRSNVSHEIRKRMIELATAQFPMLSDMKDFSESSQARINTWAATGSPALFFLFLYLINWIWRDTSRSAQRLLSRIGWHSKSAKAIAADLAKMEPSDEKGLFSAEIKSINAWVFPVDVLLGWKYRFKARRVLAKGHVDTQERDDLRFMYNEIRKQSGALIPHGNERSLGIITALREQAETTIRNHRKGAIVFAFAREELLSIMRELLTLGDILGALDEKPDLTKYHLLGLEPARSIDDQAIKKAYHSVMKAVHPDHNPGNKYVANLARLINESYGVLGNRDRRRAYETTIRL